MALGTILTATLTDIANAIRQKAGCADLYRPSQMAAAILALDGTQGDGYVAQPYKAQKSGTLSSAVLEDIGDAIRAQDGSSAQYAPEDMAAAILALDFTPRARALLLEDGTLELCYRTRPTSVLGAVSQAWLLDAVGYANAGARPYDSDKLSVRRAAFSSDFVGAGMTSGAYLFNGCANLQYVEGFEQMSGMTDGSFMFTSCGSLDSIYASSFDNSAIASCTSMFYGCRRLVGGSGTDFLTVSNYTSGSSVCKVGTGGVLTDPDDDRRTWVTSNLYSDGSMDLSLSGAADGSKSLASTGRICAEANYKLTDAAPWNPSRATLRSVAFAADLASLATCDLSRWFYGCTALEEVAGLANLSHITNMNETFSGCTALAELDLRGVANGSMDNLSSAFSGCTSLARILVDPTWTKPYYATGYYTFSRCTSLVGGNGTAYDSSKVGVEMMVVDTASTPGYCTAAD